MPAKKKATATKKPVKKVSKKKTTRKVSKVAKKKAVTKKKPAAKKPRQQKMKRSPAKKSVAKFALTKKEALEKADLLKQIIEATPENEPEEKNKESLIEIKTVESSNLSPYTIYLSRDIPSPSEIIESEELHSLSPNFVYHHWLEEELTRRELDPAELRVFEHDLLDQIRENDFTNLVVPFWSRLPKLPQVPKVARLTPSLTKIEKVGELPKTKPVDIFALLDVAEPTEEIVEEIIVEEPRQKVRKPVRLPINLRLEQGWHRALATFVLLSFSFVLPLHAMDSFKNLDEATTAATNSSFAALSNLETAAGSILDQDFQGASNNFAQASTEFKKAEDTLQELRESVGIIVSLIPATSKTYQSGSELLKAGDTLSRAASRITDAFTVMQNELNPTPVSKIEILEKTLTYTIPLLEESEAHLDNVNPDLIPDEARPMFMSLTSTLPTLTASLNEFLAFSEVAKELLGDEQKQRYLIVFQNNMELRPTGGFIGSFAELDLYQGEITKVHVPAGGSYDLQGSNLKYLAAPEPLQLINARWEFQDANWFADFPTSAKKLAEFYEQSGGPSVDGVISVNATYIADLLNLIGPIEMAEYERVFDAENFIFETQKIVEIEAEREAPKQLIGDLAPVLLDRVQNADGEDFLEILSHVGDGLHNKDIQLYFRDAETQQLIRNWGWAGDVKMVSGDYFMLVTTNIGGGKTDGIIEEDVTMAITISDDGTITNEVTITRTHPGIESDLFSGVNNVDYLRLYVPRGSRLLYASGFEIPEPELFERPAAFFEEDDDLSFTNINTFIEPISGTIVTEEFGKTVFGNWLQTKPGETEIARFVYELPWKVDILTTEYDLVDKAKDYLGFHPVDSYTLFVQKQSGVSERDIKVTVTLPDELNTIWSTSEDFTEQAAEATINQDEELFLGIVFENDL